MTCLFLPDKSSPTNYGILHSGCLAGCRYSVETPLTVKTTTYGYCTVFQESLSSNHHSREYTALQLNAS